MIYPRHPACQLHDILWRPTPANRLRHLVRNTGARLGFLLRRLRSGKRPPGRRAGAPSRFAAGSWVRILDEDDIRATLDSRDALRGLTWMEQQWDYCGTVHRVLKPVARMMDDNSVMRAISRTVMLDTVPCGGVTGATGCGRECPMMFRDEWLEEAPEPPREHRTRTAATGLSATVRSAEEIRATLDADDRCDGILFMPEMAGYAGRRLPVYKKVTRVWGPGVYGPAARPVYLLDGVFCSGEVLGEDGPCDRACRILWHEHWLRIEEP